MSLALVSVFVVQHVSTDAHTKHTATYSGKWECMGTFSAEAQPEDAGRDHTMQV